MDEGHFAHRRAAEIRFIPWVPGFFISGGIMEREREWEIWDFDQRNRNLGKNTYNTGYRVEVNYPKLQAGFFGLGYYGSAQSGMAFTLSMMGTLVKQTADVTLSNFTVTPTPEDEAALKSYVESKSRERGTGMVLLGIGVAF